MTNFVDIYQDLPSRVSEVWERLRNPGQQKSERDLSVTAMLMAAATGLAMPFGNLNRLENGSDPNWNDHPSFVNGDQRHYQAVLNRCDVFLKQKTQQPCLKPKRPDTHKGSNPPLAYLLLGETNERTHTQLPG